MDPREFIELLENPEKVEHKSVEELKKFSLQYPYSQPVQLLYTIRLSQSSEYLFNRQLGKTSLLTDDRSVLFDLFERDREEGETDTAERSLPREDEISLEEKEQEPPAADAQPSLEKTPEEPTKSEEPEAMVNRTGEDPILREESSEEESATPAEKREPEEKTSESRSEPEDEKENIPLEQKPSSKSQQGQAPLSSRDRIRAILEENRRLREAYDSKKKKPEGEQPSEMEARITAIREKLGKLRRPEKAEETEPEPAKPRGNKAEPHPEQSLPEAEQSKDQQETAEEPQVAEPEGKAAESTQAPAEEKDLKKIPQKSVASMGAEELLPPKEEQTTEGLRAERESEVQEEKVPQPSEKETEEESAEPEVRAGDHSQEQVNPEANFDPKEPHSFSEWLRSMRRREGKGENAETEVQPKGHISVEKAEQPKPPVEEENPSFEEKIQLLDSFVEKLPELKKKRNILPKPDPSAVDMKKLSYEDGSLITETLAKVYVEQKHYSKAMKAYEILKLKYPEKSSFFADQISEIKKLIDRK